MGRLSPAVSKRKREGVKGEKSMSFLSRVSVKIRRVLNIRRITVQNPATGQDLCTYALRFLSPESTFPIMNIAQRDFSFTFRRTVRGPSRPFGIQGGLLVENTRRCTVIGPLKSSSDARTEDSGVC